MKKIVSVWVGIVMFAVPLLSFAASLGSVEHEIAKEYMAGPARTPVIRHKWTMTSDSTGQAYDTTQTVSISGTLRIYWVTHDGTVTDNFDITLLDEDGKDWLYGSCSNLSSTSKSDDNSGIPLTPQGGFITIPEGNYYTSGWGFGDTKTVYYYLEEK